MVIQKGQEGMMLALNMVRPAAWARKLTRIASLPSNKIPLWRNLPPPEGGADKDPNSAQKMAWGRFVCGGRVVGLLLLFLAAWSDGVHVIDVTTVRSRAEPYASRDPLNLGRVKGLHRECCLCLPHILLPSCWR